MRDPALYFRVSLQHRPNVFARSRPMNDLLSRPKQLSSKLASTMAVFYHDECN